MATHHHPSALSNRTPILDKLKSILADRPLVTNALEIASGTGAHLEVFAQEFAQIKWQPTEYVPREEISGIDPDAAFNKYGKIGSGISDPLGVLDRNLLGFDNVLPAKPIDLLNPSSFVAYEEDKYDLVHGGNLLHICPSEAIPNLFLFARRVCKQGSLVTLYGPFKRFGQFTTESNAQFDETLRSKNPTFGIRDVESQVVPAADSCGFVLKDIHEMPSNNFLLVLCKL